MVVYSVPNENLEELQCIFWIKVLRGCKNKKLTLSQAAYINKILVKYMIQDSNTWKSFMHGIPLSHEQCPKTPDEKVHMQTVP